MRGGDWLQAGSRERRALLSEGGHMAPVPSTGALGPGIRGRGREGNLGALL